MDRDNMLYPEGRTDAYTIIELTMIPLTKATLSIDAWDPHQTWKLHQKAGVQLGLPWHAWR